MKFATNSILYFKFLWQQSNTEFVSRTETSGSLIYRTCSPSLCSLLVVSILSWWKSFREGMPQIKCLLCWLPPRRASTNRGAWVWDNKNDSQKHFYIFIIVNNHNKWMYIQVTGTLSTHKSNDTLVKPWCISLKYLSTSSSKEKQIIDGTMIFITSLALAPSCARELTFQRLTNVSSVHHINHSLIHFSHSTQTSNQLITTWRHRVCFYFFSRWMKMDDVNNFSKFQL